MQEEFGDTKSLKGRMSKQTFIELQKELKMLSERLGTLRAFLAQSTEAVEVQKRAKEALKNLGKGAGEGKPAFLGLEQSFKRVQLAISKGGDVEVKQLREQQDANDKLEKLLVMLTGIAISVTRPGVPIAG